MWTLLCTRAGARVKDSQASRYSGGDGRLRRTGVEDVGYKIHIRNQARLGAMNGGQFQTHFKSGQLGLTDTAGSAHPAQAFFRDLERGFAGKNTANRSQCSGVKSTIRLFVQFVFGKKSGAARQTARAFGKGNPLSQP